jgi:hypothetical protein
MRLTIVTSFIFFLNIHACLAQLTLPGTVNVSGETVNIDNYRFEWSLGESAAITTMSNSNSNLLVTNGFLQFNVQNQPEVNLVKYFLPEEIRVYPNPVKNILCINILHANKGKHQIELLDAKGNKIKQQQLIYNGMGALEKWNLSGLSTGLYILNIRQTDAVTGKLKKKGAFKITKVN